MNDASYKRLLTHRRIIEDLLVGFIAPRRPAGWADALDFDSLREGPTENVDDDLRRRLGDVVWSIDRRADDGSVETVHVLIEHQSSVDYAMPLRFLNYTSLLYQRLYRDHRWRKGHTADPVLHVVLYNGGTRWDAARSLAGLVPRRHYDGAAQLALSYEVVDLVAAEADDLPRPNLITWMAEVERSRRAGVLAERMRELGQWLAAEDEPELTKSFDLWLGALGRKWEGPAGGRAEGPVGNHRRVLAGRGRVAGDPVRHRHRRADLPQPQARLRQRHGAGRAALIPAGRAHPREAPLTRRRCKGQRWQTPAPSPTIIRSASARRRHRGGPMNDASYKRLLTQ